MMSASAFSPSARIDSSKLVLAFFGNRYSPLSGQFFGALHRYLTTVALDWTLLLVDTSTAAQASPLTLLRNAVVHLGKTALRTDIETASIDWFLSPSALRYDRVTPPGHNLASPELADALRAARVQLAIVAGCDQILKSRLIASVPRIVNFHNSRLPDYAGCSAVEWAFYNDEPTIGYTYHSIDSERIDQGYVIFQRSLHVRPGETPRLFAKRLIGDAAAHLPIVLDLCTGSAWPPTGARLLERVSYYSARKAVEHARLHLDLPHGELIKRAHIWGGLDLGHPRLRLVASSLAEHPAAIGKPYSLPGEWQVLRKGIAVATTSGWLEIGRLNRLWPPALAALLPRRVGYLAGRRVSF